MELHVEQFYKGRAVCKKCTIKKWKERIKKDPQKYREMMRKCRAKNKDKYNARAKEHYRNNIDKYKVTNRNAGLKYRYKITVKDYEAILSRQGGGCAVCNSKSPGAGRKHFAVDHCHETGKVRGLLCNRCNIGLGFYEPLRDKYENYISGEVVYV
jgi:hypothetical protein